MLSNGALTFCDWKVKVTLLTKHACYIYNKNEDKGTLNEKVGPQFCVSRSSALLVHSEQIHKIPFKQGHRENILGTRYPVKKPINLQQQQKSNVAPREQDGKEAMYKKWTLNFAFAILITT